MNARACTMAVLAMALVACAASRADDPRAVAGLGGSFADSPWPSDVLREGGHLRVESIPFEGKDDALAAMAASLSELDGAPVRTSIFFPLGGGALRNGPQDDAATLVDLTDGAASPTQLALFYREATRELVALAPSSAVLREQHIYGCFVGDARVVPSAEMGRALRGEGPHAAAYAPLAAYLQAHPAKVGAATVFTVGQPSRVLFAMRGQADALPPPRVVVTRTLATQPELDDLFGAPATTRPGQGDPKGIVHDAIGAVVTGTFDAPYYLDAPKDVLGRIPLDGAGAPVAKSTTTIPFFLTLPRGGAGKVPVLVYQHGLNAGRWQVAAVANDYARAGYATIGIDALWHGSRQPGAKDRVHNFSGAPGPDGLADLDELGASFLFFDFAGDAAHGIGPLDGRYVRDSLRQAVFEVTELVRLLVHGDTSPFAAGVTLDASHLVYTSESFGSVLGASVLAVSPDLGAAVLSVGGAGVFLPIFPDSPFFQPALGLFVRPTIDATLDFSDPVGLPAEAQRAVSLMQAILEPGEPAAFAPHIARFPSGKPKSVLFLQAFSDELIPNQGGELLASIAGATQVTVPGFSRALRFAELPSAAAPYAGPPGAPTVAVVQVERATHTMFTTFEGDAQYTQGFPPATKLGTPVRVKEPIEEIHAMALAFARSYAAGAPEVRAK